MVRVVRVTAEDERNSACAKSQMFKSELGQIRIGQAGGHISNTLLESCAIQLEYVKCASLNTLEFSTRTSRILRALYRNTLGFLSPYST